ncbi:MAG: cryptochrome/photolyase family protein [Candidatus Dojkabacteria bacterium]
MGKVFELGIFIFRRDLRLEDNTGLLHILENCELVLPVFILDPYLLNASPRKKPAIQNMVESLEDLDQKLRGRGSRLYLLEGKPEEEIERLVSQNFSKVDSKRLAIGFNFDYTPYSIKRDEGLKAQAKKKGWGFEAKHDQTLAVPGEVMNGDEEPYKVFTPFYKRAREIPVPIPRKNNFSNYYSSNIKDERGLDYLEKVLPLGERSDRYIGRGGREAGKAQLNKLNDLTNYKSSRDKLELESGTSHLSMYNKFGTLSIREIYHKAKGMFGGDSSFISELYWRDFYQHIGYFFPESFETEFQEQYSGFPWRKDKALFEKWCEGKTGYPIVDAAMRQLNESAYMHNRARMIVASFLTKDMLIDWRLGEGYFAEKLIDYDHAVNVGSWQWAASTGTDAQPYFRIFNPWLQQKKFDPEAKYIKRWLPELKDASAKQIHALEKKNDLSYYEQIVDHYEMRKTAISLFQEWKDKSN